ncbi:hypothetical protein JG654_12825 [Vibrio cholerae]|uniref:ORC-CDC6 family AAA ATPase n=4 Tax=Vibrio cholerae TaxID=666 RepID=UPI0018F0A465|nr:hypothetical protein [Vibrio cholerae]MBJ6957243.1 hypothetical protein [Vibrio cholerae]MBJ6961215.1 hypothetical protein [Vibrio cholerae]MBY4644572.1 hypothetical protein [Vibrio cholerae]MCR9691957.1 hypothetical protein [Vibrio cholerae]MCR9739811.1 hypothetical protein [Vibrio cholerae]
MDLLRKNPFTTIKANDLNDSEINEQWVDNPHGGFIDVFCPTDKVSQYILGGKGSGKTHLMRYFSYNSQCIRHENNILDGIRGDGYFGVYFQASGLNGERFENLPFDEDKKSTLFQYSYELWCAGLVVQALIDVDSKEKVLEDQSTFCSSVLELFSKRTDDFKNINDLIGLKKLISILSNEVDYAVSNAFFVDDMDIEILVSRGSLIFGIPKLISEHIKCFQNVTFLYLIDELENISENQQIYVNTLLREKKLPCSFRIGARGYGIKTFKTLGGGEENRRGHEYEILKLDDLLSKGAEYDDFAIDLIVNRLERSGLIKIDEHKSKVFASNPSKKKEFVSDFFESPNFSYFHDFNKERVSDESKRLSNYRKKLEKTKLEKESIDLIVSNLSESRNQVVEAALVHLFSQYWYSKDVTEGELVSFSFNLRKMADVYIENPKDKDSPIHKKINYYKNNYIGISLRARSHNNMEQYLGLDNLLQATTGFPRHILTVLRNIYKTEVFEGRMPFLNDKVSLKSQKIALLEASNWFLNECACEGALGNKSSYFLRNVCELLRLEMYADKPVECSAQSFTVDISKLNNNSKEILKWAELTRVLIKGQDRQDKNSQAMISKYHINSLLCPKWGLPLSRRGAISFTHSDFEYLLQPSLQDQFDEYKKRFEQSRYAPFSVVDDSTQVTQLDMGF